MIEQVITALWLMIPSYLPNSSAVIFQGEKPIDFGKNFIDNNRILGDGKTIRGFLGGSLCGTLVGVFQIYLSKYVGLPNFNKQVTIVAALAIGALFGDILFSFIKRRLNLKRGHPFPLVDQIDFLIGSVFLVRFIFPEWFFQTFTLDLLLIIFILTPVLHVFINFLAYKIGKKEEPW